MSYDDQDFAEIYAEYYPKIAGYLRRLVGDAEAEDVAQETFIKANKALNDFRGESSLSTWLYRIATNTAMDHLRKPSEQVKRQGKDLVIDDNEGSVLADDDPLADTLLIRKDMNACIRGLVNDLPGGYRTILVLGDLEGFTNAEIAAVLNLSLETVKIRMHRARLRLKKSMDRACHFYYDNRNEFACDPKARQIKFRSK